MAEEGTAVLDAPEEMTPGGLFTTEEFETLKQNIEQAAQPREDDIPREPEPVAAEPSPEPVAPVADEHSSEPVIEPAASIEPEVPEPTPEPQETVTVAEDGPVEFDDQLLSRAKQMGFSKEQAQKFGTPDNLESTLTALDQRLIGMGTPKVATPPPAAVPPVQPQPVAQPLPSELSIDLDPEEHDPKIVEQFQKLHSHYEAKSQQFEQVLVGLVQAMQSGQRQSDEQLIEQAVQELPENIKRLVTPEVRAQISPSTFMLASQLSKHGLQVPTVRNLVSRAARSLLTDQLLKQEHTRATDEISEKLERRSAQRTSRPTSHRSKDPAMDAKERKGQDVKEIAAKMRDLGMS